MRENAMRSFSARPSSSISRTSSRSFHLGLFASFYQSVDAEEEVTLPRKFRITPSGYEEGLVRAFLTTLDSCFFFGQFDPLPQPELVRVGRAIQSSVIREPIFFLSWITSQRPLLEVAENRVVGRTSTLSPPSSEYFCLHRRDSRLVYSFLSDVPCLLTKTRSGHSSFHPTPGLRNSKVSASPFNRSLPWIASR